MKITYNDKQEAYLVMIDDAETLFWFNTDDITEVKEEFIKNMTGLFNDSICKQLQYVVKEESVNKSCQSEEDHEWECCGMSTAGSNYVCKKCYAHKFAPIRPAHIYDIV